MLTKAGIDRLATFDLHADQIQGFYDIPVDHFVAYPQFARYIKRQKWKDMVIVSPDIGGVKRANKIADLLGLPLAIIDKVRKIHNQAEVAHVVGEVKGKTAIILDDIVDTAGSVVAAAEVIKKRGAKKVVFCASHALLSGPAVERLNKSAIDKLLFLDTVPMGEKKVKNCQILSVAPLLAEAISRIHKEESLGKMFDRFV